VRLPPEQNETEGKQPKYAAALAVTKPERKQTMTTQDIPNRSRTMNLMYEDLARAHMQARLEQARELRRGHHLSRAQRLARQADRVSQQARLLLARSL
jgi:hypothetical protein